MFLYQTMIKKKVEHSISQDSFTIALDEYYEVEYSNLALVLIFFEKYVVSNALFLYVDIN